MAERKNDILNKNTYEKWPQTQKLKELYILNNAIFISKREAYLSNKDRVGKNPYLLELNEIESLDIDTAEEFFIAEAVYEKLGKI